MSLDVRFAPLSNGKFENLKENTRTIEDNLSNTDEMSAISTGIEEKSRNLCLWALQLHFHENSFKVIPALKPKSFCRSKNTERPR